MKCPNCGFDAQNAPTCPVCGTNFAAGQPVQQPYTSQPSFDVPDIEINQAPYAQPPVQPKPYVQQPVQQSPYVQQPVQPNPYVQQPAQQNPYIQQPVQPNPYVQQPMQQAPYARPQMQQTGYVVPPADMGNYSHMQPVQQPIQQPVRQPQQPSETAEAPKKSGNRALIIPAIIIGAVILAGISLAVLSAIISNSSISNAVTSNSREESSDVGDITSSDNDADDEDDKPSVDEMISKAAAIGKPVKLEYCSITLDSVTIDREGSKSNSENCQYRLSFTVENTTHAAHNYTIDPILFYGEDHEADDDFSFLYSESDSGTGSADFRLRSDERATVDYIFEGPKDCGIRYIEAATMIDFDYYDDDCFFSCDFSKAEKSEEADK